MSTRDQMLGRLLVREKGDCDYTNGEYMLPSFLSAEFSTDLAILLIAQGAGGVEEARIGPLFQYRTRPVHLHLYLGLVPHLVHNSAVWIPFSARRGTLGVAAVKQGQAGAALA